MSTPQLERLREHCHRLRLYQVEQELSARLEQAAKQELSYADFLDQLLAGEIDSKTYKHHQMRIAMARFPFQKMLETFEFKFQPSIDPKLIRELATGRYIQSGDNLLFLGPPGVGKSHLAVALGMKACEQGIRTLFVTATALITTLGKALAEGRLEERLKLLSQPQLLICDEIGYLPIDRQGANLFFQLVSRRYERGSIIITSNQSLGAWGEVFGDTVIASAILDRLLHHSITINIKGTQTVFSRHGVSMVASERGCRIGGRIVWRLIKWDPQQDDDLVAGDAHLFDHEPHEFLTLFEAEFV